MLSMDNLMGKNVVELRAIASDMGIKTTSKTRKDDIIHAILDKGDDTEDFLSQATPQDSADGHMTVDDGVDAIMNIIDNNGDDHDKDIENDSYLTDSKETKGEDEKMNTSSKKVDSKDDDKKIAKTDDYVDLSSVPSKMLQIEKLVASPKNFFKPLSKSTFAILKESIKANGVLVPLIVRPKDDETFEILAGHNRMLACKDLGIKKLPCKIVNVSDLKAEEIIVDTNIVQRTELTPLEIANAYNKKMQVLGNRQGQRTDIKGSEMAGASRDIIAKEYKVSGMTVDRYLRLLRLTKVFENMIDNGEMTAKTGMELGLLDNIHQNLIFSACKDDTKKITTGNVGKVRSYLKDKMVEAKKEGKNPDDVVLSLAEVKKIMNGEITKSTGDIVKPIKLTIEIPADYDEETREFIASNKKEGIFFLDLIKDYIHGNIKTIKGDE